MPVPEFEYAAPDTIEAAVNLLKEKGQGAHVMAGGTDLLIKVRHNALQPRFVVGLKQIKGLDKISFDPEKGLTIGATALLSDIAAHDKIIQYYPAVAYAASTTANVQVRNMATVVGNLCNASPSADNAPTLLAMNATVTIQGTGGKREMPLDQFFKGPGISALEPHEIVTSIFVPLPPKGSGASYQSLSQRGQLDCSAVGAGAMVTIKDDKCVDARLFIGACAPVPLFAQNASDMLKGKELTDSAIEAAALEASKETTPISDVRASKEYRWKMVAVMAIRALCDARKMAQNNS